MQQPSPELQQLFSEFVQLRQSNYSPEDAWQIIQKRGSYLERFQKRQLAAMIQSWEANVGHQYPHGSSSSITAQLTRIKPLPSMARRKLEQTGPLLSGDGDSSKYFGKETILLMYLPETNAPLHIQIPQRDEIIIGRSAPDSILIPDVDMADLGERYGVSRVHASLKRKEDTLLITDLGSRNNTIINNEALKANEIRVLRNGDEVRFGNLVTRIRFQSPSD